MPLAYVEKKGFVPVRKPGKLPAAVYSQEYDLEYGKSCLEIHQDALKKGQKVLRIAIDGVLILFFIWAFGPALTLVEKMNKSLSAALQWPAGVFHLGFAVGSLAIVIAYAGDILEALGVIRGEEEEHVD